MRCLKSLFKSLSGLATRKFNRAFVVWGVGFCVFFKVSFLGNLEFDDVSCEYDSDYEDTQVVVPEEDDLFEWKYGKIEGR